MAVICRIDHQTTVLGGTSYPIAYGAGLSSSADMDVADSAGPGAENGTNTWDFSHQTGTGWSNRNFMRWTRWEDVDGGPVTGFVFDPATVAPAGGWVAMAESQPIYARFRIRPISPLRGTSAFTKWFIFGGPGITGERRMFLYYDVADQATYGAGADQTTHITVGMSPGTSSNAAKIAVPIGEWSHIQIAWRYTEADTPYMRIWINNNVEASPDDEETAFANDGMGGAWHAIEGWTVGHWADIVSDNSETTEDAVIDILDFEMADSFDTSWSGEGAPPATQGGHPALLVGLL